MAESYADNPRNRADTSVTVTPCGDGSYCCGHGPMAKSCCSNGNGYSINDKGEAVRSIPATSRAAISTPSGTLVPTSTSTPSEPLIVASITVTATPKKINAGAAAGGVVAGVVVLASICVGGFVLWRRKRRAPVPSTGERPTGVGMMYSELGTNQEVAQEKDNAPDARYQGHAELSGGERFEAQDSSAQSVIRHELSTQR